MKLVVNILDVADLVNAQAPATYRAVVIELTHEQSDKLKLYNNYESLSNIAILDED